MTKKLGGMRPFERSLPMALMNAREAVMAGFRRILGEHGVNEQQWRVIRALVEPESLETGTLAERTHLLGPSLSRILQNLAARGLLTRKTVEDDQRLRLVALTAKGRALFAKISPISEAEYQRIAAAVGPRNLESLYALLDEVQRALDPAKPEPSADAGKRRSAAKGVPR